MQEPDGAYPLAEITTNVAKHSVSVCSEVVGVTVARGSGTLRSAKVAS